MIIKIKKLSECTPYEKMTVDQQWRNKSKEGYGSGIKRWLDEGQEITFNPVDDTLASRNCEYLINNNPKQRIWLSQLYTILFNEKGELFSSLIYTKESPKTPILLCDIKDCDIFNDITKGRKFLVKNAIRMIAIDNYYTNNHNEEEIKEFVNQVFQAYQESQVEEWMQKLTKTGRFYVLQEI